MKFVLLSDLHLSSKNPVARLDDVKVTQMEKLRYVLEWALENEAVILQAGDFFDSPRSWYLLSEVMDLLTDYNIDIFTVFGQHDTYFYSEDSRDSTNMGLLKKAGLIDLLGRKAARNRFVGLYGASWGEEIPEVDKISDINVLVIHASISDEALFLGHEFTPAKKFLRDHSDFDLILCGDIHRHFVVESGGRYLVNTGPMVRRTADRYNFSHKPCFYVYDTNDKALEKHIIPCEPAEKVLSRDHIEMREDSELMLEEFVSSVDNTGIDEVSFEENLKKFVQGNEIDQEVIYAITEVMEESSDGN